MTTPRRKQTQRAEVPPALDQLLTIKQAAARLGISDSKFYRLMRDLLLGGAQLAQRRRGDEPDKQTEDRQHHQQFQQRETALSVAAASGSVERAGERHVLPNLWTDQYHTMTLALRGARR